MYNFNFVFASPFGYLAITFGVYLLLRTMYYQRTCWTFEGTWTLDHETIFNSELNRNAPTAQYGTYHCTLTNSVTKVIIKTIPTILQVGYNGKNYLPCLCTKLLHISNIQHPVQSGFYLKLVLCIQFSLQGKYVVNILEKGLK